MEGIEFETDQISRAGSQYSAETKKSAMMNLLQKLGIHNETTANFTLLGIVAIFLGIAIFMYADILVKPKTNNAAEARAILIMNGFQQ